MPGSKKHSRSSAKKPSTRKSGQEPKASGPSLHPLAVMLADKTYTAVGGLVAFEESALAVVEEGLVALAGRGDEFFLAYRQLMNFAFGLGERYPDSPAAMVLLQMLDRVAAAALPRLGEEEANASHALVESVGSKFQEFTRNAEGEKLPDTGQRLKPPRNIKG